MGSSELSQLGEELLLGYLRQAIKADASGVSLEYDEGHEWVYLIFGDDDLATEVEIDQLESDSREAEALHAHLDELSSRSRWSETQIDGKTYWTKVESRELFGEVSYRVFISHTLPRASRRRAGKKKRSRRKRRS